jgi:hypothetical protein
MSSIIRTKLYLFYKKVAKLSGVSSLLFVLWAIGLAKLLFAVLDFQAFVV